jgi:hypothetical protein
MQRQKPSQEVAKTEVVQQLVWQIENGWSGPNAGYKQNCGVIG